MEQNISLCLDALWASSEDGRVAVSKLVAIIGVVVAVYVTVAVVVVAVVVTAAIGTAVIAAVVMLFVMCCACGR